jgi:hypothetical protein
LPFQGARRIAVVTGTARQQHHQPEQGAQAAVLAHPDLLGRGEGERTQQHLRRQAGIGPRRDVLDEIREFEGTIAGPGILEVDDPDLRAVPQEVGQVGISLPQNRIAAVEAVERAAGEPVRPRLPRPAHEPMAIQVVLRGQHPGYLARQPCCVQFRVAQVSQPGARHRVPESA